MNQVARYKGMNVGLDSDVVLATDFDALQLALEAAQADAAMWKNNHDNMVDRAKLLRDRLDMPVERIKAFERLGVLQTRNAEALDLLREVAKQPWLYDVLGSVREFLAQSAPATKVDCGNCAFVAGVCMTECESAKIKAARLAPATDEQGAGS